MVPNLSRKLFGIFALIALTVWSYLAFDINLGLDLQGGSRIVYRLPIPEAKAEGLISPNEDDQAVRSQVIRIFQERLDGSGLADVPIIPQGDYEIVVELPGGETEDVERVKQTIVNQGSLQFRIVAEQQDDLNLTEEIRKFREWREANPDTATRAFRRVAEAEGGPRAGIVWEDLSERGIEENLRIEPDLDAIPLRDEDVIRGIEANSPQSWNFTGDQLQYVGPSVDQAGFPAVRFEFDEQYKAAFADFTEEYEGRQMAIVLNGKVNSAPVIQQRLPGGGIINGGVQGFSQEEMTELITVLRTGSLRIVPELDSQSFVGPSLGADSIRIGRLSASIGGVLVLIFMALYYRVNGLVACLALLFNAVILFGGLSFFQATLTLPGLAGLILTIGMAVDANILIFERVREERKRGREVPQAYKNGYERAFTTIVDANLTTLITSLILFEVGTGPVRGFAAVLSLGVLSSMFSALVFSKVIMHYLVFGKSPKIKEVSMTKALASDAHIGFLAKRKIAAAVSVVVIGIGLASYFTQGSQILGIDFTGGSTARVQLVQPLAIGEMRGLLPDYTVTRFESADTRGQGESSDSYLVKIKSSGGDSVARTFIEADLQEKLGTRLDRIAEINTVGQRVSGEIQQKAIQAILLSFIAIIIYMNFRFKEYRYGIAAVVAVLHDVLVTLGAIAVFDQLGLVKIEINLEIIAAFLTIIGYSLNDTIVVFDRIRENLPRRKGSFAEIIDLSINQSLSRTILTSVTTFFVVAVLFFFNRPQHNVLEGFSFAMLVGVVVGTYSSMFVASPMLIFLDRWARKRKVTPEGGKEKKPVAAAT